MSHRRHFEFKDNDDPTYEKRRAAMYNISKNVLPHLDREDEELMHFRVARKIIEQNKENPEEVIKLLTILYLPVTDDPSYLKGELIDILKDLEGSLSPGMTEALWDFIETIDDKVEEAVRMDDETFKKAYNDMYAVIQEYSRRGGRKSRRRRSARRLRSRKSRRR
jgi:hypothetical protein